MIARMEQDPYELLGGAKGRPVKMWTRGVPVEPEAKEQLSKLAQLPFVFHHVAVMPIVDPLPTWTSGMTATW